jgi:ATP-dependent DNA helicase RecG
VTFKNDYVFVQAGADKKDMSAALLAYCRIPRTREELVAFTGFSQYYTISKLMQPLIDAGKIRLTIPEKPKSRNQRFVAV